MIDIYSCDEIMNSGIVISFFGESGVGHGVTKDIFSKFFNAFYTKCDGDCQKVPLTHLDPGELNNVGKALTHSFIQFGQFPVSLCEASLEHALFGDVSDETLFYSFLHYLPMSERSMILQVVNKKYATNDVQPIVDVLSEYKVFDKPTNANIKSLCIRAANIALIRLPNFSLTCIVNGMGNFWKNISRAEFKSIYRCVIPTPEKVINAISTNEVQQVDQKITTWLHRFIRSCCHDDLLCFMQYITGSCNLWPSDILKVEFVDQPVDHLRPMTQTCFKVLQLPRQYVSFSQMSENIKKFIKTDEFWVIQDDILDLNE